MFFVVSCCSNRILKLINFLFTSGANAGGGLSRQGTADTANLSRAGTAATLSRTGTANTAGRAGTLT